MKYLFQRILIIFISFSLFSPAYALTNEQNKVKKHFAFKDYNSIKKVVLAAELEDSGKTKEAVKVLENLAINEPSSLETLFFLSELYRKHKKFKEAEIILKKVILKKPNEDTAHALLMGVYREQNKLDEIVYEYERFIKTKGDGYRSLPCVVDVLRKQKKIKEAIKMVENIYPKYRKFDDVNYMLAQLYSIDKNNYFSLKYLKIGIVLNKGLKAAAKKDTDFDYIKNEPEFIKLTK